MPFEELPADYKNFFETGELPSNLADEHAAAEAAAAKVASDAAAAEAIAAAAAKTAAEALAAEEAAKAAGTKTTVVDPAPTAPNNNPYLERLLADQEAKAKILADQLDEMKKQVAKLTETPPPDPQTDPLGYLAHKIDATQKEIVALRESQAKESQTQAQQSEVNAFLANVNAKVAEFTTTHPDYNDAYKHLASMRMQDFKDLGMTDAQATAAFGQEEMGIVQRALAMNKNPAEVAYGMATRYGYKAKQTVAVVEDKLDTIKKGLEAAKDATRGAPKVEPDVSNLRNMSDKELDSMVENDWDKLFGKRKGIFG